jgi:hypothetical protein
MLDVLRLILGLIADLFRSRVPLEAEVLALRQQLNVLQRLRPKRPTFSSTDRTAHPTAEWIANQLTEAFGWEQIPRYRIRDRDGAYGEIFLRRGSIHRDSRSSDVSSLTLAVRVQQCPRRRSRRISCARTSRNKLFI